MRLPSPAHDRGVDTNGKPAVGILTKINLARSMFSTDVFRNSVRPELYSIANNDPEAVHELVLAQMRSNAFGVSMLSRLLKQEKELFVKINGRSVFPFGTAAGLDKNGDALLPLSGIFGFLEPGTLTLNFRAGNSRPRVAVDEKNLDLYNAQGFPCNGIDYFMRNIANYRKRGGKTPVYVNLCGMPTSADNAIQIAMDEMRELLKRLTPYVDGFVWNCASPNTEALKTLRTREIAHATSAMMKEMAPDKLRLIKIWPYEPQDKEPVFDFVGGFMEAGGNGIVTTNTKMFPRSEIPAAEWGYQSAGRSGRFLKPYMTRSVRELRAAFPDSVIVATGGIYSGDDAYDAFMNGADLVEGYTPYTFYGLGLLGEIQKGVMERMKKDGFASIEELQAKARQGINPQP
ncbi:MAG: hypothetical protein KGH69_04030 [Candidatus Micrarchaeota archaeon]|nr:hypothetical protein [Candidatus Micrarchaeota archaeon]